MSTSTFAIGGRPIGPGQPTYIIAELSANHGHELTAAREIIEAAAHAGADAIKLQTYRPETITLNIDRAPFIVEKGTIWEGRTLHDLYAEAMTPWEWHEELFDHARALGLQAFSSPFDATAVAFLAELDVPAMKIASFELVDHGLIATAAQTDLPLIMSTGMANEGEIAAALEVAAQNGSGGVALLRCNSAYPASPAEMDLRTIADMRSRFGVPVGLSDHTLSMTSTIAAVALGACILEKHITMRRTDGGPDAAFSLEPDEFASLVAAVRETEQSLGSVRYGPSERERPSLAFRRSLYVAEDVSAGDMIDAVNVRSVRPAGGLTPAELPNLQGRRFAVAAEKGTPMSYDLLVSDD